MSGASGLLCSLCVLKGLPGEGWAKICPTVALPQEETASLDNLSAQGRCLFITHTTKSWLAERQVLEVSPKKHPTRYISSHTHREEKKKTQQTFHVHTDEKYQYYEKWEVLITTDPNFSFNVRITAGIVTYTTLKLSYRILS